MRAEAVTNTDISKNTAIKFVILLGVISLLADVTYEGARSITGPFLEKLNADATVVGFVAGLGELLGYTLRFFSGYLVDRTKKYWTITFIGYFINLLAVPLLAFVGRWEIAAALMVTERIGKAIRVPARDTMLSYAGHRMGVGWGFGLHEAMDQTGAMLGPIIIAIVLYLHGGYHLAFGILFIPAILALTVLLIASRIYPHPQNLEVKIPNLEAKGIPNIFWWYLAASSLVAAGFADFPLVAYHFEKANIMSPVMIPISYAIAMGVGALASLLFGKIYDQIGFSAVIISVLLATLFSPLVFLGNQLLAVLGMVFWGIGMGTQSSLMKAIVADMVAANKRGSAYGIFNTGYGILWFIGSVLIGRLYDYSIPAVVAFTVIAQLASVPIFMMVAKRLKIA